MGRYDKYRQAVAEEEAFIEEQAKLHDKHDDIDENTVIIETSNTFKFCLGFFRTFIKTLAGIIFIILAAIGIITLLYPELRIELLNVLNAIFREIKEML